MRWIKPMEFRWAMRAAAIALLAVGAGLRVVAQAPAAPAPRFVVVLDAAHGGDDTGGHSNDWMEKNLTLALSVRLRSLLAARGIPVVTTRESDMALDTEHRDAIANHASAQVCISLHGSLTGTGVHLFASSIAPTARMKFIPWDTAQASWVTQSVALEGVVNSALLHAGLGVTAGRTAMPVLDSMTCPAIAVEVSPDKNATVTPAESLNDASYQARVADGLAAAILEWRSEGPHLEGSAAGSGSGSGAGAGQP
jgi:N-acetylmuramoyl-L-alanine amidase